ncbi:hypothetical protein BD309DRAFT_1024170 [Dichomitus squalens]|uniref:Bacteriophage T5 Orf172 DNA-binding domain-containing protein n=2 Tax=Dichomitus squalens TaxID=114155 RepID=A0A4Q9M3H4_9APHY|nr:uncharacterized protein DICSQDRAFT_175693 [Dichomitus squalens LYAD-421 SS1]EJF55618.1 hypothetical protein DICSQDRAFT_175693 [Dichomitus squalens LYAD-421 SS1]TBU21309.1 hypothetical protein BD311DRAFT_812415 [Dichomitus squalens]TBU36649.1 hypothetical protein BD309DRAFT_1024170 [Dichomitus squalens]
MRLPHYCKADLKMCLKEMSFRCLKFPSELRPFAAWVPSFIEERTQVLLRDAIRKPPSRVDVEGLLYGLQVDDPTCPYDVVKVKIGRTTHINRHYNEHLNTCPSLRYTILGYYPPRASPESATSPFALQTDLGVAHMKPTDTVPFSHRLEYLAHLVLADVAANAPYLCTAWPTSDSAGLRLGVIQERSPCTDCKHVHEEVFVFRRFPGNLRGKEWELVIRPIIMKLALHVEFYSAL